MMLFCNKTEAHVSYFVIKLVVLFGLPYVRKVWTLDKI